MRRICIYLTLLVFLLPVAIGASRDPVRGRHGMVVSVSPYASDVGLSILQQGGNAVDAAVAVGFTLAVVHPAAGNIGGGGFMNIYLRESEMNVTIDYREMAPEKAHREMYLDQDGAPIRDLSRIGHLASGVPGSVAGMHLAWKKYGRMEWKDLITPASSLARQGFEVSFRLSESLSSSESRLSRFPETRRIFLRDGDFLNEGERFYQPELANSLQLIADEGPEAFYKGPIARQIVRDMKVNGGLISASDLSGYQAKLRKPLKGVYRGYEIISMGPPSSGGIVLIQMLNMLEGFPLKKLGFGSSEELHLKAEVMRRAFADRAHFLGDPDFVEVPVESLISKSYARDRAATINSQWATPSEVLSHGEPAPPERDETTHYSIVDSEGNAVATTTTINGAYGSGVTIKGAGFLMNNEMDDFAAKPGEPNMFGLVQGEANAVGPRKRPLSSMTPTIVKKDGRVLLVTGSPGGPKIINAVLQIVTNVLDHSHNIQEAVDATRIHHQWLPDELQVEKTLFLDVVRALRKKGHGIKVVSEMCDGHSIYIDPVTGVLLGAADPRSDSKASGY